MIIPEPYALYVKLAGGVVLLAVATAVSWHLGGLGPKAQLAQFQAKQAEFTANAVLTERAAAQAQADHDHNTELMHAKTIIQIGAAPVISTPLFLCGPADQIHSGAVPGTAGQADSGSAGTTTGGSEPVDRGGGDRRAAVEALKKRLEIVMADYRQLDSEWQKK